MHFSIFRAIMVYMKTFKKGFVAILSLCLTATALLPTAHFALQTKEASAEEIAQIKDELLLPTSYQQYLSLLSPTDVSVSEKYTAIADGNLIYFYNVQQGEYLKYEHTANKDETKNIITKLQFADNGMLYFLDSSTFLYKIDPTVLQPEKTQLVCSAFTLYGNEIFFTNVSAYSQLSKTTLDQLDVSQASMLVDGLTSKPVVAHRGGVIYYTDSGTYLHRIEPSGETKFIKYCKQEITSIVFNGNVFAFTDISGNFYTYLLSDILNESGELSSTPLFSAEGNYSALSAYGDYIYAIKGTSVVQYDVNKNAFTDFEICDNSDSQTRLHGAEKTLLIGDTLYVSDNENSRVILYNTKENTIQNILPIGTTQATCLSGDNETLLVSTPTAATLYDVNGEGFGETLGELNGFKGSLTGTACIFGNYYFATDSNYFYKAEETENGWTFKGTSKTTARNADLLSQDVYGNLYVLCGSDLYRFTEEEFLLADSDGEKISASIPAQTKQISIDYHQNVYALANNQIYYFGETESVYKPDKSLVYSQTAETPLTAFAFGVEENTTYLLYNGNFLVSTADLSLPTLKEIAVDNADEQIFSETSAAVQVVGIQKNALMVQFDITQLNEAEFFPYLNYYRAETNLTALQLGKTETYTLVAVFNKDSNDYSTYLVLNKHCQELPLSEYRVDYDEENQKVGYVSNKVKLYKFPYLTSLLTVQDLQKNTQVTILGELNRLDYDYYYVSITTEDGEITGYLPKAYVSDFDGSTPNAETVVFGDTLDESHSVERLIFLLLGAAAICILLDYLLIRKPTE